MEDLKQTVKEFQIKYYLMKQFRVLREARIKEKKVYCKLTDSQNAIICLEVKSLRLFFNLQTDVLKSQVYRKIEDFEWVFSTLREENKFLFIFHLNRSKYFVNLEKNCLKKEKFKDLELLLNHLMVYYDIIQGTFICLYMQYRNKFLAYYYFLLLYRARD